MKLLNTTTRLTGRATGASVRTMGTIINIISAKATPRLNAIAKEFMTGYEGQQTKFTVEQWQQLQELQDMNKVSPKQMELDI